MISIFVWIYEIRRDLIVLKELPLLRKVGMHETIDIITKRVYKK